MIKTLKEICTNHIASDIGFFKKKLDVLPVELKDDIEEKDFNNKYQRIDGILYARNTYAAFNGNWDRTYKPEDLISFTPYSSCSDWGNYKT